jgi:hypothetical protein
MCVSIYITGDDGGENCVVIMMTPPLHIFWLLLLLSLKKEERGEKKTFIIALNGSTPQASPALPVLANKKIKIV